MQYDIIKFLSFDFATLCFLLCVDPIITLRGLAKDHGVWFRLIKPRLVIIRFNLSAFCLPFSPLRSVLAKFDAALFSEANRCYRGVSWARFWWLLNKGITFVGIVWIMCYVAHSTQLGYMVDGAWGNCNLSNNYERNEKTIHTLPHLKCIRLVSLRSGLSFINIGVRTEVTPKENWWIKNYLRTTINSGVPIKSSVLILGTTNSLWPELELHFVHSAVIRASMNIAMYIAE